MKKLLYLNSLILVLLCSCDLKLADKNRDKWDPTPILYSVEVRNTEFAPEDRIDFTTLGEWWVGIRLHGKDISDEYSGVENIDIMKDNDPDKNMGASFLGYTENFVDYTLMSIDNPKFGAGTYTIRVKRPNSEWSNTVTLTVY